MIFRHRRLLDNGFSNAVMHGKDALIDYDIRDMLSLKSLPGKGIGMSGHFALSYFLPVVFGLVCILFLAMSMPSWIKIYLHTEMDTTLITVSIKPRYFPGYITVFRERRKRRLSGFRQGVIDWVFKILENKLATSRNMLPEPGQGAFRPTGQRGPGQEKDGPGQEIGSNGPENGITKIVAAYRQLMDEAGKTMDIKELSVQGKVGLDDPCKTALLCGSLSALSAVFARRRDEPWHIKFTPVYHRAYFALKVETVIRVSLLKGIRFTLFAKKVIAGKP